MIVYCFHYWYVRCKEQLLRSRFRSTRQPVGKCVHSGSYWQWSTLNPCCAVSKMQMCCLLLLRICRWSLSTAMCTEALPMNAPGITTILIARLSSLSSVNSATSSSPSWSVCRSVVFPSSSRVAAAAAALSCIHSSDESILTSLTQHIVADDASVRFSCRLFVCCVAAAVSRVSVAIIFRITSASSNFRNQINVKDVAWSLITRWRQLIVRSDTLAICWRSVRFGSAQFLAHILSFTDN